MFLSRSITSMFPLFILINQHFSLGIGFKNTISHKISPIEGLIGGS